MDPWAAVRLLARRCHEEALVVAGGDRSAAALVANAAELRDLEVGASPGTRFAHGIQGCFDRIGGLVSVASTLSARERDLVAAHEIGHYELHDDPVAEVTTTDPQGGGDPGGGGVIRLEAYSHRDRHEVAADAFAGEFLCPADWLRTEIVGQGRRPSEVADALGVPERVVVRQAMRALLLPPIGPPAPQPEADHPLDPAQAAAAAWSGGPLLVEAGPGTGKSTTLVHRIRHLLGSGVPGSAILVLTFSNRAAADLRARVAAAEPAAALSMWIGTFHSLGLEVVHRWHGRIGRGPAPRVLDRDGALAALERNLGDLPLQDRRSLRDPVAALSPVLRAIERCKDEMVTPEFYAAAARAAAFEGEGEAVEAAAEFAAIYAAYQRILADEDAVDLGDLVMAAATMLEGHDDIARHYGRRFAHVLVDEYQDVNSASVRLLQSLAGPGTGLWAVGDGRQSIYRFRGAGPGNVGRFAETFGGETLALGHNYRSGGPVVSAFSAFSGAMPGGAASWAAQRGQTGSVRVMSAPTLAGEAAAVAGRIEELRLAGLGYGDQAILARTHLTLDRIGAVLERQGVPLSYLGDLFARDEVRDLLSLLSIDAERGGVGLLRAAALEPYAVPRGDAILAVRWAAKWDQPIAAALARPTRIKGVSSAGASGLALLGRHLAAAAPDATAWSALTTWLFETGPYLRPLLAPGDGRSRMRLAAIYQLLKLAADEGGSPRRLLERVRRIAALGEGRRCGTLAPEADDHDAVRLMTVHGAKGLEFPAVHLPMVARHYVPLGRQQADRPPPPDLARLALGPEDHDAEERCLLFVALSRARDHLTISHAKRYTAARDSGPSGYLARIGPVEATVHPDAPLAADGPPLAPQPPRAAYPERELRTYVRCPARYRYEVVDGARGDRAALGLPDVRPLRPPGRRADGARHAGRRPGAQRRRCVGDPEQPLGRRRPERPPPRALLPRDGRAHRRQDGAGAAGRGGRHPPPRRMDRRRRQRRGVVPARPHRRAALGRGPRPGAGPGAGRARTVRGHPRPHAQRRPGAVPRPSDPRRDPRPGGRGGQRARHHRLRRCARAVPRRDRRDRARRLQPPPPRRLPVMPVLLRLRGLIGGHPSLVAIRTSPRPVWSDDKIGARFEGFEPL